MGGSRNIRKQQNWKKKKKKIKVLLLIFIPGKSFRMKRRQTLQTGWWCQRTDVCWLMLSRGRRPKVKMTRTRWVKQSFHAPRSTPHSWTLTPTRCRSDLFLLSVRLCNNNLIVFLLLTSSPMSGQQLRCRLAADYQSPHLCSLSDVRPLSQMHNNVPAHAGIFFHFSAMARSPSAVTSQGRGCTSCMTMAPWIAWRRDIKEAAMNITN